MHPNNLIEHFYTSFKNKDFKAMQDCYHPEATFSDAVFKNLDARQVRAMWEMLISKGKDLQIEFTSIGTQEHTGRAHWTATYTFSATGRKVINNVDAYFEFKEGKIYRHIDNFNFYTWAKQALGPTGVILGWSAFLKRKISARAMANLANFMRK